MATSSGGTFKAAHLTPVPRAPKVTIGLPVFNAEASIAATLQALLGQTFSDLELIVSDNASTDRTAAICEEFASHDARIRLLRQPVNRGAFWNFKAVLSEATGEYFMWAAADDFRSLDFIEVNLPLLERDARYVASTSPNTFEGMPTSGAHMIRFALDGDVLARFRGFFEHCWSSHGIFYSLIRTEVLKQCDAIGQSFFGADWAIDLFLLRHGRIARSDRGYSVFGTAGLSRGSHALRRFRNHPVDVIFPLQRFSRYALRLSRGLSVVERARVAAWILRLNTRMLILRARTLLAPRTSAGS